MHWSKRISAAATLLVASAFPSLSVAGPALGQPEAAPRSVTVRQQDANCTITGTEKDNTLTGTGKADVICGLGGDDTISGAAGNDVIRGGPGNDVIDGGNGDDKLYGGSGDDSLRGGEGSDILTGGEGDDLLSGGLGSDTCHQNPGTGNQTSCEWPSPILVCPVAHGTVYNDFGDDRGDHLHQGNDILAKRGEPVLATFPGDTTNARASGAGMYVKLTSADGSFTYGMHLSKSSKEGHYGTGDTIGYVGSTGNAGSTNHLHFEWHPGGRAAVDPFPYLSKVCPDTVKAPAAD